jgi:uncharacterized protein
MNLFVDTSFILALELTDDQHHDSALQCWRSLATRQPTLVATSYVFDEIVTSFNSRNRHDKAVEIGNRLLTSTVIQLIQVEENLFFEGWNYFQRYEDKSALLNLGMNRPHPQPLSPGRRSQISDPLSFWERARVRVGFAIHPFIQQRQILIC